MLLFRDWLRATESDRLLYEATKRALAVRPWATVQAYADAKTEVVQAILARALASRSREYTQMRCCWADLLEHYLQAPGRWDGSQFRWREEAASSEAGELTATALSRAPL